MNRKILAATLLIFMAGSVITAAPVKKQLKLTQNVVVKKDDSQKMILSKKATVASLLENLRYDDAKTLIEELLLVDKEDLDTNILLNTYLINKNRLNEAQESVDELLAKNPNNSDLHFLQGLIYLKRPDSSDMNYRRNADYYYENGISELNKALELDKTNYKALNALGVALMSSGDLVNAEEKFKEALKYNVNYATAYDNLGTLNYQNGDYEVAENRFNEAIARNSYCYTGYYHLARLTAKSGEYSTALEHLEKSLLINPSFAYAYNLAGEIYAKQQNEAAAIVNYKKAIEFSPEYTAPYVNLAKLYEYRADNEFALESLKTVVGVDKNTDTVCLKIADIELAKRNYIQAEKYYSVISEDSDLRAEAVKGLTETYWQQAQELMSKSAGASNDKLYKAVEKIDSAIQLTPDDIELRLAKLKLNKLIGTQASDEEVKVILDSQPETAAEFVVKGETYALVGEYVKAKVEYVNALNFAESLDDYKYLAEYFTFVKNYDMALNALDKAEALNPDDKQVLDNKCYVNTRINKAEGYLNDAIYFKKEGDKFFMKKYLLRAVEENPANLEANKLLAKSYKKEKNLKAECACYKQVVAKTNDAKELKKYIKKISKIEKKLQNSNRTFWQRIFG